MERKTMTIIHRVSVISGLLALFVSTEVMAVTVGITANLNVPTCTLSLPDTATHNIGTLEAGTDKPYKGMRVTVNCNNGSVSGRLYATVRSGTLDGTSAVKMNGSGSATSANPPVLQMLAEGGAIRLDNGGATDNAGAFCYGTTTRTCTLTPKVNVPTNAAAGSAKVSLRFTLRYS
ncbi:hypothetical protein GAT06_19520 [Salmonella enterica]|nr:hypothetical protein [Salmonella enterica]ECZ5966487.1 hypothetical protein [Salmonella enterica]EDC5682208.1 hypothetical protein [Salmonella enterica]EDZ2990532.1 hypothetical protein [Salmonella enterica]EEG9713988.1 hypothetical protein [Salmonella enterica]